MGSGLTPQWRTLEQIIWEELLQSKEQRTLSNLTNVGESCLFDHVNFGLWRDTSCNSRSLIKRQNLVLYISFLMLAQETKTIRQGTTASLYISKITVKTPSPSLGYIFYFFHTLTEKMFII